MQLHFSLDPDSVLVRVRDRLRAAFGPAAALRRRDPVSQLVRSMLGSRTYDAVSETVFAGLRAKFRPWAKLADARPDEVLPLVVPVTYAEDKAFRLVAALAQVRREVGTLRLDALEAWPLDEAMDWLQTLPGVGQKVAASVLNFSTLRRRVFVVDGHVLRVAARLGLAAAAAADDAGACREAVMDAAPDAWTADDFTELHALMKRLGQTFCRPVQPDCGGCPVGGLCPRASGRASLPADGSAGASRAFGVPDVLLNAVPGAVNENRPATDDRAIQAHLRRRIARLDRIAAPPRVGEGSISLGRRELDSLFSNHALSPGLHQSAGVRPEDGAAALILPIAAILAKPRPSGSRRVLMVQEADARRERGECSGPGMEALGLPAAETVFVRVRDGPEALRVADEAVRTRAAPAVLLELRRGGALADLALTRRFNLAARTAGMFVFLVTADLSGTSAAATRWSIASAPSQGRRRRLGPPAFHLDLVRNRQGRTGRWLVEWSAHERRFLSARSIAPQFDVSECDDQPDRPAFPPPVGAETLHRSGAA